jgi:16S rRNA C967 or C1407 C5-methylase (RsmB/RsmF family)/NOL1/NOP2/fmu family ribosome biogenesis protein
VKLAQDFLLSIATAKGFSKEAFERVHASGEQVTSVRINPAKEIKSEIQSSKIPWTNYGYYLAQRPSFTFDPLFHAGTYYVQEASSMFLEQALKQTMDVREPLKVLDLCASPGGKSTHIQSLISADSLLVSNEVIRSRANVLKDNIVKWGCSNVVVTNNDPKDFSRLPNYFDVIVVDAPCSGSGLFRRDAAAMDEWSENNVQLCSQRQQRILADVWPALKENGVLIYSTCSYSTEEDEDIMDWIGEQLDAVTHRLNIVDDWGILETMSRNGAYGYRCWPYKVKGEGFFLACFRKPQGAETISTKVRKNPAQATKAEQEIIQQWIKGNDHRFIKHLNTVYAWPYVHFADFSFLLEQLRVIYSGTLVGELMRDKLVPDHALAMSRLLPVTIGAIELNSAQAILYLQRKELALEGALKGWQLVTFQGQNLGWVNVLSNRINNYYPKELRILKESE